jgi:hypothetical protein
LQDGVRGAFSFHLFTASELERHFRPHFTVEEMRGLDLFHTRFAADPRWNPSSLQSDSRIDDELGRLEETYATNPAFLDRATHIMLVGRRRTAQRERR